MASSFRVASFNVENLFSRVKVFNFHDHSIGDQILAQINEFRSLLAESSYSSADKARIVELYNKLRDYIEVREDRGRLFKKQGWTVVGVVANGRWDWDGSIEFKRARFSEVARQNTARVFNDLDADIACVVEAEDLTSLRDFNDHLLDRRYPYELLIDGNDPRGIDVALYSKYPIGAIRTHVFDNDGGTRIFSRDCLEVEIHLNGDRPLYILCNHFKSKGHDADGSADSRRTRQAKRVVEILSRYDLTRDWVIVAGDLNDNSIRPPLQSLLSVEHLHNVLALQYPNEPAKRWTYHFNNFEQIDYLLISDPLKERFRQAGVLRRGIYRLKAMTSAAHGLVDIENEYDTITHWTNAASDHGAVWANFDL